MDTWNERLKESADRLAAQGTSFWTVTRGAGEGFVTRTKLAGGEFWSQASTAGEELVTQTLEAQKELVGSVQEEAEAWLAYFREELARLKLEGFPKKLGAPGAAPVPALEVPNLRELEKRLLTGIEVALQDLEAKVQQRRQTLDAVALPPPPRVKKNGAPKRMNKVATQVADEAVELAKAPITGYDELTAKEVVTKLAKLDKKKVEALLSYEQETKNRATVVTAMRAKLEA